MVFLLVSRTNSAANRLQQVLRSGRPTDSSIGRSIPRLGATLDAANVCHHLAFPRWIGWPKSSFGLALRIAPRGEDQILYCRPTDKVRYFSPMPMLRCKYPSRRISLSSTLGAQQLLLVLRVRSPAPVEEMKSLPDPSWNRSSQVSCRTGRVSYSHEPPAALYHKACPALTP